mgnify:CR=1 FL=1
MPGARWKLTARANLQCRAKIHGLLVRAYSAEPEALKNLPLPLIAHWEFNHFVVIEEWTGVDVCILSIRETAGGS